MVQEKHNRSDAPWRSLKVTEALGRMPFAINDVEW